VAATITNDDIRWARSKARAIGKRLPWMDLDDAQQIGLLALAEVAQRWRADGGASLRTLADVRIHGAIIDAHRARHQIRRATHHRAGDEVELFDTHRDDRPAQHMEASADLLRVLDAIERLEPTDRAALLRHLTGASLESAGGGRRGKSWMCRIEKRARARLVEALQAAA
jgi:RNA polymerase sigma factor (sigma-70 family)